MPNNRLTNSIKTAVLLAALGSLVVAVVALLGGGTPGALSVGLVVAFALVGASYWFSDRLALTAARARVIDRSDHPELYDMVARLAARANMPMPRVAVAPAAQPNAFATGRGPSRAVVCATEGLLSALPPRQIEAVMAHELMHIKHRDVLIGSVAAAIATAISSVAQMALFASMFTGDDEDRPNPIAVLLMTLLAPVAAMVIQLAVSRSREFEADRAAADLLGTGVDLADALDRIERIAARVPMQLAPAQAQAYIHNPLAEAHGPQASRFARWFSTHPDTAERIRRLLERR